MALLAGLLIALQGTSPLAQRRGPESGVAALPFGLDWSVALDAVADAAPVAAWGRAFLSLRNGAVTAVALRDGRALWSIELDVTMPLTLGDGLVFAATRDSLSALDAEAGHRVWQMALGEPVAVQPFWDSGWLVVGLTSGELMMLRARDGAVLWRHDPGAALHAVPAIAADRVYLPLADGRVSSHDLFTGDPVWERQLDGAPGEILPLDDRLFLGAADRFFYCLNPANGRNRWRWRVGADVVGRPALDESHVYFAALDHLLRALDRGNGSLRWRASLPARPMAGPVWVEPHVLVSGRDTVVAFFRASDGSRAPGISAPMELVAPPFVAATTDPARGLYLVATGGGTLLAYRRGSLGPLVPLPQLPNAVIELEPPPLPLLP